MRHEFGTQCVPDWILYIRYLPSVLIPHATNISWLQQLYMPIPF